jgi:hypothetical protein
LPRHSQSVPRSSKIEGGQDFDSLAIVIKRILVVEHRTLQDNQPGLVEGGAIFQVVLLNALPIFPALIELFLLRRAVAEVEGIRVGAHGAFITSPIDVLAAGKMAAIKIGRLAA